MHKSQQVSRAVSTPNITRTQLLHRSPHLHSQTCTTFALSASYRSSLLLQIYSEPIVHSITMSSSEDLDARAAAGETVVPGGTGGKSVQAQQNLAEGRSRGGQARAEQLGHDGYVEMGKKGGSATSDMSGGEAAATAGRDIDEAKFTN